MIISHKHRFIFFAVPRTATHTIRQALRAHLGEEDWEQQMLTRVQTIPIPEISAIKHGHVSFQQIERRLSTENWATYFKFSFVRNPLDRYVSICFFLNRQNHEFTGNEVACMKQGLEIPRFRQRILVVPQSGLLTDAEGTIAMDYVGRYELLQTSYDEICRHIGIESVRLTKTNTSNHMSYENYYDEALRDRISRFYRSDFELFGYDANALGNVHNA